MLRTLNALNSLLSNRSIYETKLKEIMSNPYLSETEKRIMVFQLNQNMGRLN